MQKASEKKFARYYVTGCFRFIFLQISGNASKMCNRVATLIRGSPTATLLNQGRPIHIPLIYIHGSTGESTTDCAYVLVAMSLITRVVDVYHNDLYQPVLAFEILFPVISNDVNKPEYLFTVKFQLF